MKVPYNASKANSSYNRNADNDSQLNINNIRGDKDCDELIDVNEILLEKISSEVPQSAELVKTVNDSKSLHKNVLLNSDELFNNNISQLVEPVEYPGNNKDPGESVSWKDMFDTVLFTDIDHTEEDTSNANVTTTKEFKTSCTDELKCVNDIIVPNNSNKRKKKAEKEPKDEKLKQTKIKKASEEKDNKLKQSYRKQKYSKAIKNWLKDIESIQNHEQTKVQYDTLDFASKNITGNNNKLQITFNNKTPDETSKKTIQTQLSNVNGIMRFKKPKNTLEETIETGEYPPVETIKDKKVKSKFLAPIKSKIPVKDITYNIVSVSGDFNFRKIFWNSEEIIITLIYSNGFCQLNSHYTEDTGEPRGVMVLVKDQFFYIKDVSESKEINDLIESNTLIFYEGKDILMYLRRQCQWVDIPISLKVYDVKIGASLLNPDNLPKNFSELQNLIKYVPEYTIVTDCPEQTTAWYMTLLKNCWNLIRQSLIEQALWNVFVDIEMRVLPILADMEYRGVRVDLEKLKRMELILLDEMKSVEQACYKAAGKKFQINSTLQVRTILYDELKLDSECNVKIRETICKGAKSTSEAMLRSVMNKHPLPKLILEYRRLHKAHATFLSGVSHCVQDGVVKPVWEQSAAATGRIASNTPNLQAVPKAPFILQQISTEDKQVLNLRSLYVSREGHWLLAADFRQVECRVLAMAAADTGPLRALHSADLFRDLAASWLNKPEAAVTQEERERTKRVVYASMYGAGANKLADVLSLSYERALEVAASFNRTFPALKTFGRAVVSKCERDGQLRTPYGRVRHFKNIASENFDTKAQAERKAVNFIIQGSAADLCKMAMVLTEEALRTANPQVDCRLLLQIHDELVWEVRDGDLSIAAAIIKTAMEGCGYKCGMPMVLPVALSVGRNWGEMSELTLEL
ncbi:DNA polymerase nu-like [Battus philenor]|uniref:DNA polymerase nu-like n=1 Tax=Battus philenor TaxID=42288 RepID=UPI0035CF1919